MKQFLPTFKILIDNRPGKYFYKIEVIAPNGYSVETIEQEKNVSFIGRQAMLDEIRSVITLFRRHICYAFNLSEKTGLKGEVHYVEI